MASTRSARLVEFQAAVDVPVWVGASLYVGEGLGDVGAGVGDVGAGVGDVGAGVGDVGAGDGVVGTGDGEVGGFEVGAGVGDDVVGAGWLGTDVKAPPVPAPEPEPRAASRGCVVVGAAVLVGAGEVLGLGTAKVRLRSSGMRGWLRDTSSDVRLVDAGASAPPAVIMIMPRPDPEMITAVTTRNAIRRPRSSRR